MGRNNNDNNTTPEDNGDSLFADQCAALGIPNEAQCKLIKDSYTKLRDDSNAKYSKTTFIVSCVGIGIAAAAAGILITYLITRRR